MLIDYLEQRFFRQRRRRNMWQSLAIDMSAILLWRGLWGLMDLYIFPGYQEFSFIFSALLGLFLLLWLRPYVR